MIIGEPDMDWAEWDGDDSRDEATRLLALREYIVREARRFHLRGDITADWANKKLRTLGVTEQVGGNQYLIEVPVSGTVQLRVDAADRAEAEGVVLARVAQYGAANIGIPTVTGPVVFISGPEDTDTNAVIADAPTTVQDTLDKLREVLLLGVIAGPKFCESGLNPVLRSFGLAPVPARTQYVVTRPATATLRTVVEAFDEASAERVAGWRWDNGRAGYEVAEAEATDGLSVDVN